MYRRYGKRWLDLVLSSLAIVMLSPVITAIAALVRWRLGTPVLFRQQRPGLHGTRFTLRKFRTMTDARGEHGELLPDAERLTPFGRFLRGSSLDELPELFNVVRGDMSLVGPRPLLARYLERYTPEQMRRHDVRPGITGLAQVSGRNIVSWDRKFELDLEYVATLSLRLDCNIMALTLLKLVQREGINEPGQATAQEYMGPSQ